MMNTRVEKASENYTYIFSRLVWLSPIIGLFVMYFEVNHQIEIGSAEVRGRVSVLSLLITVLLVLPALVKAGTFESSSPLFMLTVPTILMQKIVSNWIVFFVLLDKKEISDVYASYTILSMFTFFVLMIFISPFLLHYFIRRDLKKSIILK